MYLTITSTAPQATDLGYLLHKHPDQAQQFEVSSGLAHVFYPEATSEKCTVALLLEVDPIKLVRGRRSSGAFALSQYVNDRPYAASSMLAVALGKVFKTALAGKCEAKPELVNQPLPLEIHLPAVPSVAGAAMVRDLFEPLGWTVQARSIPLDETIPDWGESRYVDVQLGGIKVLSEALSHLYVLLPVLDSAKHYWVSVDEVDKLVRVASSWLPHHPHRELITKRYLAHQRDLVISAVSRLAEIEDLPPEELDNAVNDNEERICDTLPLAALRKQAVLDVLHQRGVSRVVDIGCGEGALLQELIRDSRFTEILGTDVSARALQVAERRLNLDRMPDSQRARLRLIQSSLTYRDERIVGYDAVVLMEVIEHLDPDRLPALEHTVFAHARPTVVIVTTPNAEHNVRYPQLSAGTMRHPDHRFEWTRAEFSAWANSVCARTEYTVHFAPIGEEDPEVGPPTQMAVFHRTDTQREAS